MRITTCLTFDIETGEILEHDFYDYEGPVDLCCGPSNAESSIAGSEEAFMNTLQSSYNTNFAQQQNIINQLNKTFSPIVAKGPNQTGMSSAELSALNTNAIDTTGANYANAARAVGAQEAGRGGGGANPSGLLSGPESAVKGSIASSAAGQLSGEENAIQQANYNLGRQNFFNAAQAEAGTAALLDPNSYAGSAISAGNSAFSSADKVQQEKNQEQADIAGSIAGLGLDAATFGAGALGGGGFAGGLKALSTGGGSLTPAPQVTESDYDPYAV